MEKHIINLLKLEGNPPIKAKPSSIRPHLASLIVKKDHKANRNLDQREKLSREGKSRHKYFYPIDHKLPKELEPVEAI